MLIAVVIPLIFHLLKAGVLPFQNADDAPPDPVSRGLQGHFVMVVLGPQGGEEE